MGSLFWVSPGKSLGLNLSFSRRRDHSSGVAGAGHRSLPERLFRAPGRASAVSLQPGIPGRGQGTVMSLPFIKVLSSPGCLTAVFCYLPRIPL